jgi:hypothetical protein
MEAAMEKESRKRVVRKVGAVFTAGFLQFNVQFGARPPLGHALLLHHAVYDLEGFYPG